MAGGNAIVARLGLETKEFNRALLKAEADTKQFANNTARSIAAAARQRDSGIKQLVGKFSGAGELVSGVGGAFGLSLGGMAATGAVAALLPKLVEIAKGAREAEAEVSRLLRPGQPADYSGLGELEKRISGLQTQLDRVRQSPFASLLMGVMDSQTIVGAVRGKAPGAKALGARRDDEANKLLKEQQDTKDKIAQKAEGNVRVLQLEADGQETAARHEKIRLEYAEKRGALLTSENPRLFAALKAEEDLKHAAVDRDAALKRQKEISEALNENAKRAIENVNKEIGVQRTKADLESAAAGERHDKEQDFQTLAKQGRRDMIQGIRDEQAERAKAAAALAAGIQGAANGIVGNARERFIAAEMGGPNQRRQAKRDATRAAASGRKFDRLTKGVVPGLLDGLAGKIPNPPGGNPLERTNQLLGEIKAGIDRLDNPQPNL